MNDRLKALADAGVSIWLDDLSRERLETGNLADLVKNSHVVGVTSNPAIFQAALADGERYDPQVRELAAAGADVDKATQVITTDDVRDACMVMRPVFDATDGVDGRVSIEVSPGFAHDTGETVKEAAELWRIVDQPNLLIKIPGTKEGWPAITETIAAGISVNVTLIFGLEQYRNVMEAYVSGPRAGRRQRPRARRHPLGGVVLRLARRQRDRQAARGHDGRAGHRPRPCAARPASPTRGSPSRCTRSSSAASAGRRSRPRARASSARCGRRPV